MDKRQKDRLRELSLILQFRMYVLKDFIEDEEAAQMVDEKTRREIKKFLVDANRTIDWVTKDVVNAPFGRCIIKLSKIEKQLEEYIELFVL